MSLSVAYLGLYSPKFWGMSRKLDTPEKFLQFGVYAKTEFLHSWSASPLAGLFR